MDEKKGMLGGLFGKEDSSIWLILLAIVYFTCFCPMDWECPGHGKKKDDEKKEERCKEEEKRPPYHDHPCCCCPPPCPAPRPRCEEKKPTPPCCCPWPRKY